MKIYALVYTYKIKKENDNEDVPRSYTTTTMTHLVHEVGESLENVMNSAERRIKKLEGYIQWSLKLDLRNIMPLDNILDDIKVKLPELVQNAKQREKLTKVAKVLNDYDNQS